MYIPQNLGGCYENAALATYLDNSNYVIHLFVQVFVLVILT